MTNLRLSDEAERTEANGQAHTAASLDDLAKQFLYPLIEHVVSETIAGLESPRAQQAQADEGPALWGWKQIAKETGMSRRALERLEATGEFGPRRVKLGTAVRFFRAEVLDWFAARCPKRDQWRWHGIGQNVHSPAKKGREK